MVIRFPFALSKLRGSFFSFWQSFIKICFRHGKGRASQYMLFNFGRSPKSSVSSFRNGLGYEIPIKPVTSPSFLSLNISSIFAHTIIERVLRFGARINQVTSLNSLQ
ncbi:Elongation factor P [Gossypium arboreum]|uniref:Elongation factor P n=1 Tax=Gossypium arboreum TaxID=29729 RepID=A0A0B0MA80_GOSAR|nr:Elongation factor P [Gossypium arboreum]